MSKENKSTDFLGELIAEHGDDLSMQKAGINKVEFDILPELDTLIELPSEVAVEELEASILEEGVRDPLILGIIDGFEKAILIDGHNRNRAIKKLGITTFATKELHFNNIEEVKMWMLKNQLGRRNLNPVQTKYYRGVLYNMSKGTRGGLPKTGDTSKKLAKQFGVSDKTIRRDGDFAKEIDELPEEDKRNHLVRKTTPRVTNKTSEGVFVSHAETRLSEFVKTKATLIKMIKAMKLDNITEMQDVVILNEYDKLKEI